VQVFGRELPLRRGECRGDGTALAVCGVFDGGRVTGLESVKV
jgi:GTPase